MSFRKRAVNNSEINNSLKGSEEFIHCHHNRWKVSLLFFIAHFFQCTLACFVIWIYQDRIELPWVTHQKDLLYIFKIPEIIFNLLRGNCLAFDIFVNFFLPVNYFIESVSILLHDVAGGEPAINKSRVLMSIVIISHHHISAFNQQLSILTYFCFNTRKGTPQRILNIFSGWSHGDSAGGFGHAETAH